MNEYDLINCYLNLIFDNSFTYFTRILDGYRGLCQFRKWMRKRNINLNAIENIGYDAFNAICKAKNREQIIDKIGADKARAAGDDDVHCAFLL